MLDQSRRDQINGIIDKMKANKEDEQSIRGMVDQFKSKFDQPEAAQPAPSPQGSAIFPSASQVHGSGIGASAARVGLGALDLMGVPARGLATARGMSMSDPDAYLLRPEVERFKIHETPEDLARKQATKTNRANALGSLASVVPSFYDGDAALAGNTAMEFAGRTVSDPVSYAGLLAKTLTYIPGIVKASGRSAGILNKGAGRLAEEMSGVSQEALRVSGTQGGRDALRAAAGKEGEVGNQLLHYIDNADDYMPERDIVNAGLDKLPAQSVQPAIDAMDAVRSGTIREGGRIAPHARPAHGFIENYMGYLRGGDLPPDLAEAATEAGRASMGARSEALAKGGEAAIDTKQAAQAARQASAAQSKAAKAAGKAGATKKEFLGSADKNLARYGRERNDAGAIVDAALEDARDAAARSKDAAIDARAKAAVGQLTEGEAAAAEAAAESADRSHRVAQVADRLHKGESIKAVAKDLSAEGLSAPDIGSLLKAGKTRLETLPKLPPQEVSAKGIRDMRRDLDVPIDFEAEGADIRKSALKAGRGTIKNQLINAADASGDAEYAKAMRTWSDKLDKLDRVKDLIGQTGASRERRVEQFVNNLFGKNNKYKTRLMEDLDGIFGSNMTADAKTSQLASQLGATGEAGWMPRQFNGRSALGYVTGAGAATATGNPLAVLAPAFFASPKIAARFTLPMLTKLETSLKAAGVALTPRAASTLAALKRPISEAQKARLATILAAELETQMPANAIPFRQKVAEEEAPADYITRR